jgi:hypothetical protein
MANKKNTNQRRPARVIEDTSIYLLQLSPGLFYFRTSGDGRPLGVAAPSVAEHMSYKDADRLCQQFRSLGYNGPVVTDIYGQLIDNDALESERRIQAEKSAKFWGD